MVRLKWSLPKLRLNRRVGTPLSSQYESCRAPVRGHLHSLPSKKPTFPCINLCSCSFNQTKDQSVRLCGCSVRCLQRTLMNTKPHKSLGTEGLLYPFLWCKHRTFAWCHPSKAKSMKFHLCVDALEQSRTAKPVIKTDFSLSEYTAS